MSLLGLYLAFLHETKNHTEYDNRSEMGWYSRGLLRTKYEISRKSFVRVGRVWRWFKSMTVCIKIRI
jgi:hypothetical protein